MKEIIVKNQKELDEIPVDFDGRIIIKFGTPYNRAVVNRCFCYRVVAWENSSVDGNGNSQITDSTNTHKITVTGNSRIVYNPRNISEYIDFYNITRSENNVLLYKAVHKKDGRFLSDHNNNFEYIIGGIAVADKLTTRIDEICGHGIHMAYKEWCVDYGRDWDDLAILEVEADISEIVVPVNGNGKIRAKQAKIIREIPVEECGISGKIYAKKHQKKGEK